MMPNVHPMPTSSAGRSQTTDGSIALRNLDAQIEGLQVEAMSGYSTAETQLCLIDLLVLRGRMLGRIADYRRAEQLANQFVRETGSVESFLGRARIHALFHRFPAALDDLDIAQDLSIDEAAAEEERAAIFQGLGRYDEALALRKQAVDRCPTFESLAALAGLYAERGEIEAARAIIRGKPIEAPRRVAVPACPARFPVRSDVDASGRVENSTKAAPIRRTASSRLRAGARSSCGGRGRNR